MKYCLLTTIIAIWATHLQAQKTKDSDYQVYAVALFLSENNPEIPKDTVSFMLDTAWINTVAQFLQDIRKANPKLPLQLPEVTALSLDITFDKAKLKSEWLETGRARNIIETHFLEAKAPKSDIASKMDNVEVLGNQHRMDWLYFADYLYKEINSVEKFEGTTVELSKNNLWNFYRGNYPCKGDDCEDNYFYFDSETKSICYGQKTFLKSKMTEKRGWDVRYNTVTRQVEEFYTNPERNKVILGW